MVEEHTAMVEGWRVGEVAWGRGPLSSHSAHACIGMQPHDIQCKNIFS